MWFSIFLFCLRCALYIPVCIIAGKRKAIRGEPLPVIPFSLGIEPYIRQSFALFCVSSVSLVIWIFPSEFFTGSDCGCFEIDARLYMFLDIIPIFGFAGVFSVVILTFINNLRRLRDLNWPRWLALPLSIPFFGAFASFFLFILPGAKNGFDAAQSSALRSTYALAALAGLLALAGLFA